MSEGFASFREFYPFYLGEHRNRTCRRLHFIGTSFATPSTKPYGKPSTRPASRTTAFAAIVP